MTALLPLLAPLAQREHRGKQRRAFLSQTVFDLAAVIGHRLARQDTMIDEAAEAIREDVARDAQRRLKLFEMVQAVERAAQDQERPAFADRLQRRWQSARCRAQVFLQFTHLRIPA